MYFILQSMIINMTLEIYIHLLKKSSDEALNFVEKIFSQSSHLIKKSLISQTYLIHGATDGIRTHA